MRAVAVGPAFATRRRASARSGQRVFAVVSLFLLAAAFYLSTDSQDVRDGLPLMLIAASLQTLPLIVEEKVDPFSPAALSGLIALSGFAAIIVSMVLTDRVEFGLLPTIGATARIDLLNQISIAHILGTVCYQGGYYVTKARPFGSWVPGFSAGTWNRGRLRLIAIACSVAFLGAYAYFQGRVGTSVTDLDLGAGKAVWRDDQTLSWLHRGVGLGMVPPLFYAALMLNRPRLYQLLSLSAVTLVMMFLVLRVGQRGYAVLFAMNLLVLVHYFWRPVPLWLILVGGFMVMAGFNVLGKNRLGSDDTTVVRAQGLRGQVTEVFAEHETDRQRLSAAAVVMYYFPERRDFLMGESWLPILVAPIPRWIYPEKSQLGRWSDTSIVWQLVTAPVPSSYQFTLYANFGWIGIALGMFGWGVFHRGLRAWHERSKTMGTTLLYASILIYFGPTTLHIGASMQTVVPVAVGIWFIANRAQAKGSRALARR